ncbi:MAG: lytic transglycosylase domain-containing protein [Desulfobulbaceae bacterium]|nr:MAG: lytic transglycosylase domain-containing protein [Desulfobulbaceae bacterium]
MHQFAIRVPGLLVTLWLVSITAAPAYGDFKDSIKTYKSVQLDPSLIVKIEQYDHLIKYFCGFAYHKKNNVVNRNFVKALIIAESSVDPGAVSVDNARGLGQIVHETGKAAARVLYNTGVNFKYIEESKLQDLSLDSLHDPAINILLTVYLISRYNYRFNGKIELVVTAWNAGENNTSLNRGRVPGYSETEDLIGKVNGYFLYLNKMTPQ